MIAKFLSPFMLSFQKQIDRESGAQNTRDQPLPFIQFLSIMKL